MHKHKLMSAIAMISRHQSLSSVRFFFFLHFFSHLITIIGCFNIWNETMNWENSSNKRHYCFLHTNDGIAPTNISIFEKPTSSSMNFETFNTRASSSNQSIHQIKVKRQFNSRENSLTEIVSIKKP